MTDLHFANEHECTDIFTAIGNLDELVLKAANIRFEVVLLSHFDGEDAVVTLLGFPAGGIFDEERLGYILEIVERMRVCIGRE